LVKIARVLGTDLLDEWMDKYGLYISWRNIISKHNAKQWNQFMNAENTHLCVPDAIDLLSKLLRYDPYERLTAKEAMDHQYFANIKSRAPEEYNH